MNKDDLRPALILFTSLLVVFAVLSQLRRTVWLAGAGLVLLMFPGMLLTASPHSFGIGTVVVAFVVDYLVLFGILRELDAWPFRKP